MKHIFTTLLLACSSLISSAQENMLQILDGNSYTPISKEIIDSITFINDPHRMVVNTTGGEMYSLPVAHGVKVPFGVPVPLISITTEEELTEIPDKKNYKDAEFVLDGFGTFDDVEATATTIRGRGNSSWMMPKKPYRLKFPKKISICGLPKAKSYVLLANYTDATLMKNALAMHLGQMFGLPFTNQIVPVDVVLNGIYKGSYTLTNHPGINSGSVDIDEENSIMFELDTSYDEDYVFMSPLLNLPVMVKDPDMNDELFEEWKQDFIEMEEAAVEGRADDYVDFDIFAKYLLVYEIMQNNEIGHPKSVKLYKTKGGKYMFGPIWDFDSCMGHVWNGDDFTTTGVTHRTWRNELFHALEKDPLVKEAIQRNWASIRLRLPEIMDFLDDYAEKLRSSAMRNMTTWGEIRDFETSFAGMKNWLTLRFEALDNRPEFNPQR